MSREKLGGLAEEGVGRSGEVRDDKFLVKFTRRSTVDDGDENDGHGDLRFVNKRHTLSRFSLVVHNDNEDDNDVVVVAVVVDDVEKPRSSWPLAFTSLAGWSLLVIGAPAD